MTSFDQVYSEYYGTVFQYVLSLCGDASWAEEITQDAFLKALQQIGRFRGECKLSVWLCQIAKNTLYTQAKKQKREAADIPLETLPDTSTAEEDILNQAEALSLHRGLHTLGEPYKEVFWMRTFGELPFKEIGVIFGKTESWARVTYHRAKAKIKEAVK